MKKIVLSVVFLMLMTNLAMSQVSFGGGGQLGFSIAMFPDPLKDYYGMGFGFGGHGDVNLMKFLTVRLNVDYYMFGFDNKKYGELIAKDQGVAAGDITMEGLRIGALGLMINGIGKIPTKSIVTPYGILGFGLYMMSASDPKVSYKGQDVTQQLGLGKTESSTEFALNFGGGSEFQVGNLKLYAEIKFVMIFTKGSNSNHLPISFGVTIP